MMRLIICLAIFSALLGCGSSVPRPDALICGINAKAMKLRCYNIKNDFTEDGVMKPGVKPTEIKIDSIKDLNAGVYMAPADFEKVKVWLADARSYMKEHCK